VTNKTDRKWSRFLSLWRENRNLRREHNQLQQEQLRKLTEVQALMERDAAHPPSVGEATEATPPPQDKLAAEQPPSDPSPIAEDPLLGSAPPSTATVSHEAPDARAQRIVKLGYWTYDASTSIFEGNPQHFRNHGLDELLSAVTLPAWLRVISSEDRSRVGEKFSKAIEYASPATLEYQTENQRAVRLEMQPDGFNEEGRCRLFGTSQDVTELRMGERMYRQITQRFYLVKQAIRIGTWEWTPQNDHFYRDREADELLGVEQASQGATLDALLERLEASEAKQLRARWDAALRSKSRFDAEFSLPTGDHQRRYLRLEGTVEVDKTQQLKRVVGILLDVTRQKQAETQLQRDEAFRKEAQRMARIAGWGWNLHTNEFFCTEELYEIFSFSTESALSPEMLEQRIHANDRSKFTEALRQATEDCSRFEVGFRVPHEDGSVSHLVALGRVLAHNGVAQEVWGAMQDVTESKRLESQLLRSEKLQSLGTLAANTGHELKNPLAVIRTQLEMMEIFLEMENYERIPKLLQIANEQTLRAASIIDSMRVLAWDELNKEYTPVLLRQVLDRSLLRRQREFEEQQVQLTRCLNGVEVEDYQALNEMVKGNFTQLEQVMSNLMSNALDAMKHSKVRELHLHVTVKPSRIVLSLRDTGCGVTEEHLGKIFDPFFTTKPPKEGIGLGLAVCLAVVTQHGGDLEVESQPQQGCTFHLNLPLWKAG
jgi:C4-dicarboxylate-specific signal transduction histidine kinase